MNVRTLLAHLQAYTAENPANEASEVYLRYDGDVIMEFGRADKAAGVDGSSLLVFSPAQNGNRLTLKQAKLDG